MPRRPEGTTWRSGSDAVSGGATRRCIIDHGSLAKWKRSAAYRDLIGFISELCEAISGRRLTEELSQSPRVRSIRAMLSEAGSWIDELPPQQQAMRYGNPAFRKWHERLCERAPALMRSLLETTSTTLEPPASFIDSALCTRVEFEASLAMPVEQRLALERAAQTAQPVAGALPSSAPTCAAPPAAASKSPASSGALPGTAPAAAHPAEDTHADEDTRADELAAYFAESFGNATRIDYGTGHELAFMVWLRWCALADST